MNMRRISAIALSNRDYASFDDKLKEAARWISLAAAQGSDLAVLPEALNLYRGDGPGNPAALQPADVALEDWRSACHILVDCATKYRIAVTVPVYVREGAHILNCFYLVSKTGEILGRYVKTHPTPGELSQGVTPAARNQLIPWEGLRIGGAICFDMNFLSLFQQQAQAGADLFLCPSLFHGGDQVNYYAATLRRPIAVAYPAWSRIVDIMGREMVGGGYRHETLRFGFGVPVSTAEVNFDRAVFPLDGNQDKIEGVLRRYGCAVKMEFDQDSGCFSLESSSQELTVTEMIKAFDLAPMDEYLGNG